MYTKQRLPACTFPRHVTAVVDLAMACLSQRLSCTGETPSVIYESLVETVALSPHSLSDPVVGFDQLNSELSGAAQ